MSLWSFPSLDLSSWCWCPDVAFAGWSLSFSIRMQFEIWIGHWPVMSDPSLDRRLLDMYIISCYYCRRSRVGVTGIQYFRLVMMLLGSRCRCTLYSVSDLNIRKTKFGEYLECSRSLFGVSRSQFGVFSSRNIYLTGGLLLISFYSYPLPPRRVNLTL